MSYHIERARHYAALAVTSIDEVAGRLHILQAHLQEGCLDIGATRREVADLRLKVLLASGDLLWVGNALEDEQKEG